MDKAKWIDVKGYEGIYAISSNGNVKSYDRKINCGMGYRISKGRKLKTQINNKGYEFIVFSVNGLKDKNLVHRLVAKAFIPNPRNLPCVNHIDSNPLNNRVENLEWVTYKENTEHAINAGRFDKSFAMTNEKFKEDRQSKMRSVVGTCVKTSKKIYFESIQEAGRSFNGRAGDICRVCKGQRQTAQGYRWKYADD